MTTSEAATASSPALIATLARLTASKIVATAAGHFKLIKSNNGRKDYIETLDRWGEGNNSLWSRQKIFRFLPALAGLVLRYITNSDFRIQIESAWKNDQQRCFIDEIMTHERLFFEKVA